MSHTGCPGGSAIRFTTGWSAEPWVEHAPPMAISIRDMTPQATVRTAEAMHDVRREAGQGLILTQSPHASWQGH